MGVKKIFDGEADLSGLSSTNEKLIVSEVVQKSFINVTEIGTEAAAATGGQCVIGFNNNIVQNVSKWLATNDTTYSLVKNRSIKIYLPTYKIAQTKS